MNARRAKKNSKIFVVQFILYAVLIFSLFMSFLPIIISLFNSFKNDFEIMTNVFAPPTEFDFWGFAKAWSDISKNLWNGVFVALVAGIFNTVLGSLIAYIFQQKQFIGKEFLYKFYIFIMLTPSLVGLPIQYSLVNDLHLINNYFSIWLTSLAGGQVGALFLFRTFLGQHPGAVYEAARIDGANDVQIYLRISIPLAFPIMMLNFINVFSGVYNDYFWPSLVIKAPDLQPVMAVLKRVSDSYLVKDLRVPYAMCLICSLPLIVTTAISMKYFSSGDFAAGIKL